MSHYTVGSPESLLKGSNMCPLPYNCMKQDAGTPFTDSSKGTGTYEMIGFLKKKNKKKEYCCKEGTEEQWHFGDATNAGSDGGQVPPSRTILDFF